MKPTLTSASVALCLAVATGVPATEPALETDEQKTLYVLGLAVARPLINSGLLPEDITTLQIGLRDAILDNEPKVADAEAYVAKIDLLLKERIGVLAEEEKAAGRAFMDQMAQESGVVKTDSGMLYLATEVGSGDSPLADSTVRLHYQGTLRDGTIFDSSIVVGEPVTFPLTQVAPCFAEGVQRMKAGGKSRLICPSDLAYGDQGYPPQGPKLIPPGATLIFDIELFEVVQNTAGTPAAEPTP